MNLRADLGTRRSEAARGLDGIGHDGPRQGRGVWPATRRARTLTVEVLAAPSAADAADAFPRFLTGVHERADTEARERPDVDHVRVSVPGGARWRTLARGERLGNLAYGPFPEGAIAAIARRAPTVSVHESHPGLGLDSVCADDASAIASLVGSLRAAGHARIGFLALPAPAGGSGATRRFEGFLRGLEAHGLEFHRDWVVNVHRDVAPLAPFEAAAAACARTLGSGATAWVCADDRAARVLIEHLHSRGIRVPAECSVTGYGGLPGPAGLPRVVSAGVPHEHIGSSALTRLLNRILYPSSPPRQILVEARLVPGDTLCAPPCR